MREQMEKVKLTQEQADMMNKFLEVFHGMRIIDIARALKEGWKIEPEFKINDWIKTKDGHIYKLLSEGYGGSSFFIDAKNKIHPDEIERHATDEEILFAKNNRSLWELKEGDVIFRESNRRPNIISKVKNGIIYLENGYWHDLFHIKEYYKVVCFVEDRKDLHV